MPEAGVCPVCAEPLADRPERCFRCETALGAWWPFEASLGGLVGPEARARESSPAAPAPPPGARTAWVGAAALLAGVLAASAFWAWRGEREARPAGEIPSPVASRVTSASPVLSTPSAARQPVVAYRVQRGDSLWRIAAAFTGDGRNWRKLWPDGDRRRLLPGAVVEVPASRLRPDAASAPPPALR